MNARLLLIICLALAPLAALAEAGGQTPGDAIPLADRALSGSTQSARYYLYSVTQSGILTVTMKPTRGEASLSVTHVFGSPSAESRRGGGQTEEIRLAVKQGDRFLIRVSATEGVAVQFKLAANLQPLAEIAPVEKSAAVFVPRTNARGEDQKNAVLIPLGRLVPVEATGERWFAVEAPAGYILAVTLYPVTGEADLEMSGPEGGNSSRRGGIAAEYLYLPVTTPGAKLIQVMPVGPRGAIRQYVLVARLRQPGLSLGRVAEPDDLAVVRTLFREEALGAGVPAALTPGATTEAKVLRLR